VFSGPIDASDIELDFGPAREICNGILREAARVMEPASDRLIYVSLDKALGLHIVCDMTPA